MKINLKTLAILSVVLPSVAGAQTLAGVQEQLDALKEEVIILNRKVYRDRTDSVIHTAADSQANVKLGEYDEIIRTLNGKIDEMGYQIKQLEEKIDTINKDTQTRFNLLEGKPVAAATGSFEPQKKHASSVANGAPKAIVGDAVTAQNLKTLDGEKENVEALYKKGLEALKNDQTEVAEQDFMLILDKFPQDKLAGNAQYWLGEVYYKNQNYAKAAVAFGKGYEKYKDGAKGADSLLKLGFSMEQLGKKAEACTAFKNLPTEFPKAEYAIRNKAQREAQKLGCQ